MPHPALLVDAAWAPGNAGRAAAIARSGLLALAGSLLIAACAHLRVPMWPVPMTMQTFAVLLIGMAYGARLGAATVALYIAEGALGLPVFANGGGPAYLLGPTGGYLAGCVAAAAVAGLLAQRGWSRPAPRVVLAMLAGTALIYSLRGGVARNDRRRGQGMEPRRGALSPRRRGEGGAGRNAGADRLAVARAPRSDGAGDARDRTVDFGPARRQHRTPA